ncbi:DUF2341 domain-containing protein [Flagellimonas sp.]|uniref:DUF2341 domain-containing protein n=1 Tax=Flagellimonas sp. TaxID=2058762 RepID=UPI003B5BB78F
MRRTILINLTILFILSGNLVNANTKTILEKETIAEDMFAFPGWNRKQPITIQASQVAGSGNLTDFPVLITLNHLNNEIVDGGANSALDGGGDIRFSSDAAGNNQLAIEVVDFVISSTPANRRCQIWVKVPSLSATSNTTIYIWYNKAGEVQPAATSSYGSEAVWSSYSAVWHMDTDPSGTIPDASGNGHSLSSEGYMNHYDLKPGTIGNAIEFDGINDQMLINGNLTYGNSFSFSVWFNWNQPAATHNYSGILTNKSPWDGFWTTSDGGNRAVFYDGTQEFTPPGSVSSNASTRYDFVATNGDIEQFINSVSIDSNTQASDGGAFDHVGSEGDSGYFPGWIDELRVDSMSRSSGWLTTEYNNQLNPATFATAGTPENVSGSTDTQPPSTPTNLSSVGNTDTTADLSWNLATDNIGVTGYKIFKDGTLEATLGNVTTYQVTGLAASTTYGFMVTALDAAGNESAPSSTISVTTDSSSGGGGSGGSVWSESNSVASYAGDVAIGTNSVPAGYKMAIDGKLITEEVKVQLSGNWPDYVFKEGYDLPTLEEIQKYIKEKGRLPNIPSAKEVEANGVDLGEMDKLLLEKIEQLILFTIKQQQLLQEQQKEIEHLSTQNEKMVRFEKELTLIKQLLTQSSKQ